MTKKILIVDDSPVEIQLMKEILLKQNYEVVTCGASKQTISIAEQNSIDLILLDIVMPEADGYKVIRKLKANEKTKEIPVIFVSSKNIDFDILWGKKQGAIDYVTKPIDKAALIKAVEENI